MLGVFSNYIICIFVMSRVDIIGHVAKKDTLKEKDYNGKKTFLLDLVLEDLE